MAQSLRGFASSCLAAKENCTLNQFNFTSPDELLGAIGNTVDTLYNNPEPIYDLSYPVTVTASDLRYALGGLMYSITDWPLLADGLALVLSGNYTVLAGLRRLWVNPEYVKLPDTGAYVQEIIFVSPLAEWLWNVNELTIYVHSATTQSRTMTLGLLHQRQRLRKQFYTISTKARTGGATGCRILPTVTLGTRRG